VGAKDKSRFQSFPAIFNECKTQFIWLEMLGKKLHE